MDGALPVLTRLMVASFVDVRALAQSDPPAMMEDASSLLHEPGMEEAIRIGDVYGMMIEYDLSPASCFEVV
jgi:hypothetical protein